MGASMSAEPQPVKGGSRRDKAEATRRKILRAAHEAFVANGYHGTTIAAVARRAGVATQTVYFTFHTKAALISAVIDLAVLGEDEPTIPQESPWWTAMAAAPTASDALRAFVHGAGPLFARAGRISEILRAAALTDDEVRQTYEHHEALRRAGYAEVIDLLMAKGRLRAGLDRAVATDVLLTMLSDATYDAFTSERGWSHERVVAWLAGVLPEVLLEGG